MPDAMNTGRCFASGARMVGCFAMSSWERRRYGKVATPYVARLITFVALTRELPCRDRFVLNRRGHPSANLDGSGLGIRVPSPKVLSGNIFELKRSREVRRRTIPQVTVWKRCGYGAARVLSRLRNQFGRSSGKVFGTAIQFRRTLWSRKYPSTPNTGEFALKTFDLFGITVAASAGLCGAALRSARTRQQPHGQWAAPRAWASSRRHRAAPLAWTRWRGSLRRQHRWSCLVRLRMAFRCLRPSLRCRRACRSPAVQSWGLHRLLRWLHL